MLWSNPCQFQSLQRIGKRRGVSANARLYAARKNLFLAKGAKRSRFQIGVQSVNEDHCIAKGQVAGEFKPRRSEIFHVSVRYARMQTREGLGHGGTNTIVPKKEVANPGNQDRLHSTFTAESLRPFVSKAWQAQAMQGSKACKVRSTSSGRSGSATCKPASADS